MIYDYKIVFIAFKVIEKLNLNIKTIKEKHFNEICDLIIDCLEYDTNNTINIFDHKKISEMVDICVDNYDYIREETQFDNDF